MEDLQTNGAPSSAPPEAGISPSRVEINKVNTSNGNINNMNQGKRVNDEDNIQQPPAKKRKKCDAHEGAVPFRTSMIQLEDVKKFDQKLIVEGDLHYGSTTPPSFSFSSSSVHLELTSNDPSTGTTHCLSIRLEGTWAVDLLKDISLPKNVSSGRRVRLAFKEGKLVKEISGPERNPVVFTRGCELWVCKTSPGEEAGEKGETWKRYRTFAAAQNRVKTERTTTSPEGEGSARSTVSQQESVTTDPGSSSSSTSSNVLQAQVAEVSKSHTSLSEKQAAAAAAAAVPRPDYRSLTYHAAPDLQNYTTANSSATAANKPQSNSMSMAEADHKPSTSQPTSFGAQGSSVVPRSGFPTAATRHPPNHQYQTISDIRKLTKTATQISVIGLAFTSSENKPTSQGHHSSSFKIVDPSCFSEEQNQEGYNFGEGLTVTFMHPRMEYTPQNVEHGDVVLIRNIKTQTYKGKTKITSFAQDTNCVWAVAKTSPATARGNSSSGGSMFLSPNFRADMISPQEYAYARDLHEWNVQRLQGYSYPRRTSSHESPTAHGTVQQHAGPSNVQYIRPVQRASAYRRLNDLQPLLGKAASAALFDCVVEIIAPPETDAKWLKLYITDYSTHSMLRPHPELAYLSSSTNTTSEGSMLVVSIWRDDFSSRLDQIARDLGEVGNIVDITGIRTKDYGGFFEGHVGGKRPEFGWRIIKNNEEDPRKTQLLDAKKALLGMEDNSGARFMEEEADKDNSFADSGYDSVSAAEDNTEIRKQKAPSAGPSATTVNEPLPSAKKITKLSKSRKTSKLSELTIPRDSPDASCFFDCYCEIVEDVYDTYASPVRLYVTDYNINDYLFENTQHSAYPSQRIIFEIAFWDCQDKIAKIKTLKEGDRVLMENIRAKKSRSYNLVEGNVGSKGEFRVTVLDKDHPEWAVLQQAREKQEALASAELQREVAVKPKKEQVEYVQCKRQAEPVVSYQHIINNKESAQYRLRGRVVAVDRSLDEILVNHCNECQQFLKYGSTVCEKCPPGKAAGFTPRRWRFGLSIELEPPGRDISKDAVNNDMTVWVHVDEKDPDLVFMNGLQPTQANLAEAQALLKKIVENPSAENHTNPIFDFCAWSFPKQGVLLMIKTALVREGQGLPWAA